MRSRDSRWFGNRPVIAAGIHHQVAFEVNRLQALDLKSNTGRRSRGVFTAITACEHHARSPAEALEAETNPAVALVRLVGQLVYQSRIYLVPFVVEPAEWTAETDIESVDQGKTFVVRLDAG